MSDIENKVSDLIDSDVDLSEEEEDINQKDSLYDENQSNENVESDIPENKKLLNTQKIQEFNEKLSRKGNNYLLVI